MSHLESNGLTDDVNLAFIEEVHGSNANFIIATLICNALKNNASVLFVTFHNSFQHYQQLCSKLGCNLSNATYRNKIQHLNPMDILVDKENKKDDLDLQEEIGDKTEEFFKTHQEPMYLIMDDISYILLLKSFPECSRFIRYYVFRRQLYPNLKVIFCSHVFPEDKESVAITNYLRMICKFSIKLTPLSSGLSSEVTGHMEIRKMKGCLENITKFNYLLNRKEFVVNPSVI